MNVVGIVPARMAASRFPGKPMKNIVGMPMIGHCYHRTDLASGIDAAYVATCDKVIFDYVESIGGNAVMTSDTHTRATTRTAEAMEKIEQQTGMKIDIVVMVQGDEPMMSPKLISKTIDHFENDDVNVVNIMSRITSMEQFLDTNNVKVVVNLDSDALYFSREGIPSSWQGNNALPMFMQTGVIAFRRDALIHFNSMKETPLEIIESVDMNRILESGGKIRMVATDQYTLGIDTPVELAHAEDLLTGDPVLKLYME